jgi:hypothetical protein
MHLENDVDRTAADDLAGQGGLAASCVAHFRHRHPLIVASATTQRNRPGAEVVLRSPKVHSRLVGRLLIFTGGSENMNEHLLRIRTGTTTITASTAAPVAYVQARTESTPRPERSTWRRSLSPCDRVEHRTCS